MTPDENIARTRYSSAWRDYRRRRVAALLTVGGFAAFCVIAIAFHLGAAGSSVLFLLYAALFVVSQNWWIRWRCPRCGRQFRGTFWGHTFARTCGHCGLPKWAGSERA